jgi:hypothetical protein
MGIGSHKKRQHQHAARALQRESLQTVVLSPGRHRNLRDAPRPNIVTAC